MENLDNVRNISKPKIELSTSQNIFNNSPLLPEANYYVYNSKLFKNFNIDKNNKNKLEKFSIVKKHKAINNPYYREDKSSSSFGLINKDSLNRSYFYLNRCKEDHKCDDFCTTKRINVLRKKYSKFFHEKTNSTLMDNSYLNISKRNFIPRDEKVLSVRNHQSNKDVKLENTNKDVKLENTNKDVNIDNFNIYTIKKEYINHDVNNKLSKTQKNNFNLNQKSNNNFKLNNNIPKIHNNNNNYNDKNLSDNLDRKQTLEKIAFDVEYPIINLADYPKESIDIRVIVTCVNLLVTFFIIGIKLHLSINFDFPTFCDLKSSWDEFDNKVLNKTIIMLEEKKCAEYCTFNAFVISHVFQLDHLIFAFSTYFLYFKNINLDKKIYVKAYLLIFPLSFNILKNFIFFKNKLLAYSINSFIIVIGSLIILFEGKNIFFLSMGLEIPLIFFALMKFFFENIFIFIYSLNPEVTRVIFPFIITGFKFLYFKFILFFKSLQRHHPINKWICLVSCSIFDFVSIGNLHLTVEKGLLNYTFAINILLELLFDINLSFQIFPKLVLRIKNRIFQQSLEFRVSDFEAIYIAHSLDSDINTTGMYFFLILFKYFNMSQSEITDCFGRPLISKVNINGNHFLLCLVLLFVFLLKIFLRMIIKKYVLPEDIDYQHFPKLKNKWHYFSHVFSNYILNSHFGFSSLYAMLAIKS